MMKTFLSACCIFLLISGCSVTPLYRNNGEKTGIYVDVIANRDGQQLHRYLKDGLRDVVVSDREYRMTVTLSSVEKPFAEMTDESAQRVELRYVAHVVLKDAVGKVVFEQDVTVSASDNVSSGHGDVIFSIYGRNNRNLLKELSNRIIEYVRIFVINEK